MKEAEFEVGGQRPCTCACGHFVTACGSDSCASLYLHALQSLTFAVMMLRYVVPCIGAACQRGVMRTICSAPDCTLSSLLVCKQTRSLSMLAIAKRAPCLC